MAGLIKGGYLLNNFVNRLAIRIEPSTQTLKSPNFTNLLVSGDISTVRRIATRGSRRGDRPVARRVRFIFFPIVPDGYKPSSELELPVTRPEMYDQFQVGGVGEYKGFAIKITKKIPEHDPRN